ncbi:hypothetical protein V6259_12905 [Marinomonas sp. TI.3.20]|uniref:hypothetical protein n=1 Tax=Marinomonas sp. TI.3.20 TaxID=3121296 RepID=UPI00311D72E4
MKHTFKVSAEGIKRTPGDTFSSSTTRFSEIITTPNVLAPLGNINLAGGLLQYP